jgi:hypothetical protein
MTPATAVKAANTVMLTTAERPLSVGLLEKRGLQQQYQQQKVNNQQQGFKQQRDSRGDNSRKHLATAGSTAA